MDIKNIAIVRATNIIPFNGIVYPLSEEPYLKKETGTKFSNAMQALLQRQSKLIKPDFSKIDLSRFDEEIDKINKENNEILRNKYMPYNSGYNPVVLWALNGLVPDDQNNTFSNKACAIIDGLEEHIDSSEVVSLVPTDTAIKGKDGRRGVYLSKNAIILISKERYETLSKEQKERLESLDLKVSIFEGDLKQAVNESLEASGRFTAETLSLRREDGGYSQSSTSDELKQVIKDIATERGIPQELYWNIYTEHNDDIDRLESVKGMHENFLKVRDFYEKTFFVYMFSKLDISEDVKNDVLVAMELLDYMKDICDEIERIGLDEYKKVLDEYNARLEKLQKSGELPTPQQIIDSINRGEPINLQELIEKKEMEHSADGELKDIAMGENIESQQNIVLETKEGVAQRNKRQNQDVRKEK